MLAARHDDDDDDGNNRKNSSIEFDLYICILNCVNMFSAKIHFSLRL